MSWVKVKEDAREAEARRTSFREEEGGYQLLSKRGSSTEEYEVHLCATCGEWNLYKWLRGPRGGGWSSGYLMRCKCGLKEC